MVTKSVDAFTSSTLTPPIALAVSVNSRNVTLPENEVTLSAYVVPQARAGNNYQFRKLSVQGKKLTNDSF